MTTLTQPIKWPGGKHYLAPKIVAMMPPHTNYVEPYAGGLSVLLSKGGEGVSEVVNDISRGLTNFWRTLQGEETFGSFARRVQATPFSEVEYEVARDYPCQCRAVGPCVPCAADFFIRCRQSLAGRMDTFAAITQTRLRRGMNEQVSAWLNCVEGLPAVHARLKRVLILNRDAVKVIKKFNGKGTVMYIDPPYLHETRSTTGEYGTFEMTNCQHAELLTTLAGVRGRFLLSGYHSEMYDDAARKCGWHCREFDLPNNAAGGTEKRRMVECVWTNYPVTDPLPGMA